MCSPMSEVTCQVLCADATKTLLMNLSRPQVHVILLQLEEGS